MSITLTPEDIKKYEKNVKQVIIVRTDLKMPTGKIAAQVAHASDLAVKSISTVINGCRITPLVDGEGKLTPLGYWDSTIFTKIVLGVKTEEEMIAIYEKAKAKGLPCSLITDSGLTCFNNVKTKTCVGIGPAMNEDFTGLTDHLKRL